MVSVDGSTPFSSDPFLALDLKRPEVIHFTALDLVGSTSLKPHTGQQMMLQSGCTGHEPQSWRLSGWN